MNHPRSRAERRSVRLGRIACRRYVAEHVWGDFNPLPYEHTYLRYTLGPSPRYRWEPFQWGRYAKWNMNCGCKGCHSDKYFKEKRKCRRALDLEVIANIRSWAD
jgi:hypothetical protein